MALTEQMEVYLAILSAVALTGIAGVVNGVRFSRSAVLTLFMPVIVVLILPAALRWHTGWDWESYDAMLAAAPTAALGSNSGDILFDVVLRFAALQHISIYAICASVIVGGFFLLASRWCPTTAHVSFALVFFLWYGYYGAWSTIRQGVSIVFFTAAVLTSRSKRKWCYLAVAALFHRSALLPVVLYVLYNQLWSATTAWTKGKRLAIGVVASAVIVLRLMPGEVSSYFLELSAGIFGASRTNSLATNTFFIEPYPLISGRMAEMWATMLVLGQLGFATAPDTEQALTIKRLFNLQVLHLFTYLLCSPITFIAERQVLFFDYIHCFSLSYAIVIFGIRVTNRNQLGCLRSFTRRNCIVSVTVFSLSLAYIANRYVNILSADSRDPVELTHHDRFIPYRTAP